MLRRRCWVERVVGEKGRQERRWRRENMSGVVQ